jgi:alpha-beta hydrolase superfamily lysophospholipase
MARFVLVHGAFSEAWIWGPLIDRLKATGPSVEVFDLPGSGDDHRLASEVTLVVPSEHSKMTSNSAQRSTNFGQSQTRSWNLHVEETRHRG